VILVLVAQVIAVFQVTFQLRAVCVAVDIGLFKSEVLSTFHSHTSALFNVIAQGQVISCQLIVLIFTQLSKLSCFQESSLSK
jgi:hypothetical protein